MGCVFDLALTVSHWALQSFGSTIETSVIFLTSLKFEILVEPFMPSCNIVSCWDFYLIHVFISC